MIKSSNPALRSNIFIEAKSGLATTYDTMTIQGTVNKTAILLLLVFATSLFAWNKTMQAVAATGLAPRAFMWGGLLVGLVLAFITIYNKKIAHITAPLYALAEGFFLGAISVIYEMRFPGIVGSAILGTFSVFFVMLFLYKSKIIKPTENLKLGIAAATGGIFFIYMGTMLLRLFGLNMPYIHNNGPIGILFSVGIIIVAALNLVMDFDFIEQGEEVKAPKYMEWYGAFGLLVTLVWLYMEILRLLSKLKSR